MGSLHGYEIAADRELIRLSDCDGPLGRIEVRHAATSLLAADALLTQLVPDAECRPLHLRAARGERQLSWSSDGGSFESDPTALRVDYCEADASSPQGALRWEDRLGSTAIPLMLGERGGLPIHASAVQVGASALLICAISGRGKSTLAALMASRGHRQISEDGVVVFEHDGVPAVWPGMPGSLVTDAALAAFGNGVPRLPASPAGGAAGGPAPDTGAPPPSDLRGRRLRSIGKPATGSSPVGAVAILMDRAGERAEFTLPEPARAHRELLAHVLSDQRRSSSPFAASARLVESSRVALLRVPDSVSALPEAAAALESLCEG